KMFMGSRISRTPSIQRSVMSASSAFSDEGSKGGSSSVGEPEYGHDPASGGIFSSDYKRHDDLKEMLDSNKDSLKLEAMKRIVANTSDLFPAVVKNVACKNIEDPNQLIRASALRVLLDPEQKDQLIEVIEKLLADKTTLVAGSVVMAFEEESLLEEGELEKTFYGSDDDEDDEDEEDEEARERKETVATLAKRKPYVMDPDHRLLLRNTKPLLQSRNAAVVMAVAQLYFHLAPKAEVGVIAKALVRLLRSHSEVQYVVLQNVATMTIKRRGMFEPYLKSFYIRSTDPTQIKVLKAIGRCATNIGEVRDTCLNGLVQLLSNRDELVVAESVVVIKKLLQMQPEKHSDIIKHMAKLTDNIQVPMARASILWLIGEYCEHVPKIAPDVLRKMAKSFTNEEDIVKLQIINLAAKLYLTNSKQTKLLTQYVLNLAKYDQNYDIRDRARFIRQLIVPTDKCGALSKYAKKLVLALKPAPVLESPFKDRDHFQLGSLSHLLNTKAGGYQELPDWPQDAPDPSVRNVEVKESVPEWTKCSSREKRKEKKVEKPFYSDSEGESGPTESADSESDSASSSASGSRSERSASGSGSEESEEPSDSEEEEEEEKKKRKTKPKELMKPVPRSESEQSSEEEVRKVTRKVSKPPPRMVSESESEEEDEEDSPSDSSQSESEDSESEAEVKKKKKVTPPKAPAKPVKKESKKEKKEMSLLDFDDFEPTPSPQVTPVGNFLSSSLVTDLEGLSLTDAVLSPATISPSSALKSYELLHRITGEGLWVEYCFSRQPFIPDPHMVAVQVQFSNSAAVEAKNLRLEEAKLQSGMRVREFPEIEVLPAGESTTVVMGIDFCDSTQAANLQLCTHTRKFFVSIQPPLMGMNEISEKVKLVERCQSEHAIVQRVMAAANLSRVPCGSDKECRFAGRTVTSGSLVLVTVATKEDGPSQLTVNCEKMVIGTMLVKDIMLALTQ
ncbi:hypothetical protein CRUP_010885, partial [Coryphaenoides rupestris]